MTKRDDLVVDHVRKLTAGFSGYVEEYDRRNPFVRSAQLAGHVRTLKLRAELGSAASAVQSDRFLSSLYETLQAWGIGMRGSRLVSRTAFGSALQRHVGALDELKDAQIDDPALDAEIAADTLWSLISSLGIVENDAPLVAGSKALHHLLPDLMVPIDRAYTRPFFGWYGQQFQYQQERAFREMLPTFNAIGVQVELERFLGKGWRTARAKIIDNAVVGFCLAEDIKRA